MWQPAAVSPLEDDEKNMDNNGPVTDDVIAVYNEHVAVISEIKRSQWQTTNYLILLFAAILALRTDIRAALPEGWRQLVGIIGPVLLWVMGGIVIVRQHQGLTRRRSRIKNGRKFLSDKAIAVYGESKGDPTFGTDKYILLVFLMVTAAAAALCVLLLTA